MSVFEKIKGVVTLRVLIALIVVVFVTRLTYMYIPSYSNATPARDTRPYYLPSTQTTPHSAPSSRKYPQRSPKDPCLDVWERHSKKDSSLLWWQWACLFEKEIDKPYPYKCKQLTSVGNWHICSDELYIPRKPCIVYSFGIAKDFTFDDAMAKRGCVVYSFDPSMGVKDYNRSSRVYFKNLGIGSHNTDNFTPVFNSYVKKKQTWKMRTLKSIKKMLGHENAVIDVLKIDIELHEWSVVVNMLQDETFQYIRQFLVEWHIFPTGPDRAEFENMYNTVTKLEKIGLKFYYLSTYLRRHNITNWNSQADMCYVNTNFTKPSQLVRQ